jgi:solute carrier family 25 (mitochondrial citrate transporter), member 1
MSDAKKHPAIHLLAGGAAGVVESGTLFPLDTVKTRMQLRAKGGSSYGPFMTAKRIIKNEGFFSLYKGLTAVMAGIAPKMAVRFSSFDIYKGWLGCLDGKDKGNALPCASSFL